MNNNSLYRLWSEEEEEFLIKNKDIYTLNEFTNLLNRSNKAIKGHLHRLGISVKRPPGKNWYSKQDIEFLKNNYNNLTKIELARILNKKRDSINTKLIELNLEGLCTNIKVTSEQLKFIKENYLTLSNKQLAERLNFNETKVASLCFRHNLRRKLNYDLKNQKTVFCSCCKKEYPNTKEYFYIGKTANGVCKSCRRENGIKCLASSPNNFLRSLLNNIKSSNRKNKCGDNYNIDLEYLVNIYNNQNGKCNITGIDMTRITGKGRVLTNISIDRIDSSKGYLKGNIQLVCVWANIAKTDLTQFQFEEYIKASYNKLSYK